MSPRTAAERRRNCRGRHQTGSMGGQVRGSHPARSEGDAEDESPSRGRAQGTRRATSSTGGMRIRQSATCGFLRCLGRRTRPRAWCWLGRAGPPTSRTAAGAPQGWRSGGADREQAGDRRPTPGGPQPARCPPPAEVREERPADVPDGVDPAALVSRRRLPGTRLWLEHRSPWGTAVESGGRPALSTLVEVGRFPTGITWSGILGRADGVGTAGSSREAEGVSLQSDRMPGDFTRSFPKTTFASHGNPPPAPRHIQPGGGPDRQAGVFTTETAGGALPSGAMPPGRGRLTLRSRSRQNPGVELFRHPDRHRSRPRDDLRPAPLRRGPASLWRRGTCEPGFPLRRGEGPSFPSRLILASSAEPSPSCSGSFRRPFQRRSAPARAESRSGNPQRQWPRSPDPRAAAGARPYPARRTRPRSARCDGAGRRIAG
jgi:hypothetical protein